MKLRLTLTSILISALGMVVLTGCPPKKKLAIEEQVTEDVATDENIQDAVLGEDEVRIEQDWTEVNALGAIQFEFDAASLSTAAKATLKTNVGIIKKLPKSVKVRVEGHCDDRGTVEYNIALGQRRANVVRSFYTTAGITKDRIETISYGEERPICNFQTDGCWAQNRRAVTKLRNSEAITVNIGDSK